MDNFRESMRLRNRTELKNTPPGRKKLDFMDEFSRMERGKEARMKELSPKDDNRVDSELQQALDDDFQS